MDFEDHGPGGFRSEPPLETEPVDRRQGLPPISLFFLLLGTLRQLLIPLLASAVAAPGIFSTWILVLLVPAVLGALIRLWTFTYEIQDEELVIRQGFLTRNERNIPFSRIQNLDLVENPLHRIFNVAEVRLETASGGKPEAVIRVLTHDQIAQLRHYVAGAPAIDHAAHVGQGEVAESPGLPGAVSIPGRERSKPLVEQSTGELAILGLLSNRGLLVVAAAAGLLQQTGFFDNPERFEWFGRFFLPSVVENFDPSAWSLPRLLIVGSLLIIFFLLGTRLLSAAWMMFTLHGFRLERRGEDFSTSYGLMTRVTATLPRKRLQLLSIRRPFLAQPWRLASMKVETAGGGGGDDQRGPGAARLWLAPLIGEGETRPLIREAMPVVDPDSITWRAIDPRAPGRLARRNALLTFLLAMAILAFLGPLWALLFSPLVGLGAWLGARQAKRSSWGFATAASPGENEKAKQAIFFRSGTFEQRESLVPLGKIQCVSLRQTPFDRRWRMATLRVDTAGASAGGHRVEIPYLEIDEAQSLAQDLAAEAAQTTFLW